VFGMASFSFSFFIFLSSTKYFLKKQIHQREVSNKRIRFFFTTEVKQKIGSFGSAYSLGEDVFK
jgi:hypothetical protein